MKKLSIIISKCFFLIFFLGFFGSNTFFNHVHIVDGVTIVHSHPYKSNSGDGPVNHQHSENGFHLIQLIAGFIATASVFFIIDAVLRRVLIILFPDKDEIIRSSLIASSANRPRGPTLVLNN